MSKRWLELWSHIDRDLATKAYNRLFLHYCQKERVYHNLGHITECLRQFDMVKHLAANRFAVEIALWYHDAVYLPHEKGNEEASADLMESELKKFATVRGLRNYVRKLILATKHDSEVQERDQQLVVDIDLHILGAHRRRYESYSRAIRKEYSWVPMPGYAVERPKILQSFLDRQHIFYTDHYRATHEQMARENLAWEIEYLTSAQ